MHSVVARMRPRLIEAVTSGLDPSATMAVGSDFGCTVPVVVQPFRKAKISRIPIDAMSVLDRKSGILMFSLLS